MAVIEFTKEDVGKSVVDANGQRMGQIVDTRGGAAYVDPDPDAVDAIKSKLGWNETDDETYEINGKDVEEATDQEVRLHPL